MKKKFLAAVILSALSVSAFAENMYGSVSVGSATLTDISSSGQTANGTSYSVMFGYEVNKYFAAEVGYTSLLSDAPISGTPAGLTPGLGFSGKTKADGEEIAAVGSWPVSEQFSALFRVGYAVMTTSTSYALAGTVGGSAVSMTGNIASSSASGFVWGPGMKLNLGKDFDLRAGYNIYMLTGSGGANTSTTTIGGVAAAPVTKAAANGDAVINNLYVSAAYHF